MVPQLGKANHEYPPARPPPVTAVHCGPLSLFLVFARAGPLGKPKYALHRHGVRVRRSHRQYK